MWNLQKNLIEDFFNDRICGEDILNSFNKDFNIF